MLRYDGSYPKPESIPPDEILELGIDWTITEKAPVAIVNRKPNRLFLKILRNQFYLKIIYLY